MWTWRDAALALRIKNGTSDATFLCFGMNYLLVISAGPSEPIVNRQPHRAARSNEMHENNQRLGAVFHLDFTNANNGFPFPTFV